MNWSANADGAQASPIAFDLPQPLGRVYDQSNPAGAHRQRPAFLRRKASHARRDPYSFRDRTG